jgi:predicted O-methyltransferase YrrM
MKPLLAIRRLVQDAGKMAQIANEIRDGIANQSHDVRQTAQLSSEIRDGIANQSDLFNRKLSQLIEVCTDIASLQQAQLDLLTQIMQAATGDPSHFQKPPAAAKRPGAAKGSFQAAMESMPLLIAEKTYNTSHPDYDATQARNFPGRIFNHRAACDNAVFWHIRALARDDTMPDTAWEPILAQALAEAKTVPHAEQVFERKAFIERYLSDLGAKYGAHYVAGWVNLEDALFLYWIVRQLKPRTIVQTGVCNGLSSAFMMLALANNGPDGTLHVIDLPAVFNPNDPAWTVKNKVYGVVIPQGKSSGWMVPDAYRDRFHVHVGDAKQLLPRLVDSLDTIDMFYHDSDHTYDHMLFEFRQAKRKLTAGGLILGDDISWNASLWDFADEYGVPSYNYKGAVGVAFF